MMRTNKILFIVPSLLTVFMLTGCGKDLVVNRYPDFYRPAIREVVVLPFENQTSHKGLGREIARILAADLMNNGTYKVIGPSRLHRMMKDKGVTLTPDTDYPTAAQKLNELNGFQAFITGRIHSESFQNIVMPIDSYDYDDDEYFYDDDMFYPYFYFPYYYDYGTEIYLSVNSSMVNIPEGTVLGSTNVTKSVDVSDINRQLQQYGVRMAMNDVCQKLVREFAVVPVKLTVHPYKDLKTADSVEQDNWHFTNTFSRDEDSMYVVLCLPGAAVYNQFKLTISPVADKTEPVVQKDITWSSGGYCQSFEFSPKKIAAARGPGRYTVQFHSRGKIIMTHGFKIK